LRETAIQTHDDPRKHPNKRLAQTLQSSQKMQANLSQKFYLAA